MHMTTAITQTDLFECVMGKEMCACLVCISIHAFDSLSHFLPTCRQNDYVAQNLSHLQAVTHAHTHVHTHPYSHTYTELQKSVDLLFGLKHSSRSPQSSMHCFFMSDPRGGPSAPQPLLPRPRELGSLVLIDTAFTSSLSVTQAHTHINTLSHIHEVTKVIAHVFVLRSIRPAHPNPECIVF